MILVTGATGHIGNVLIRELLARGQTVRALLLPSEDPTPLEGLAVERVEGDVLDVRSLETALKGVSEVFHLAGLISILPGMRKRLHQVNVVGTQNMLRASGEAGVRRFVYTSSIHAIAAPTHGIEIDESLPFDPGKTWGDYDRSKAQATLEVREAVRQGLDAVIVCPTGVIGPHDYRRSEMGQFLLDCARPGPKVYVDGAYDFVDVRDVAFGHVQACDRGRAGESYIFSGTRLTVRRIVSLVEGVAGVVGPHLRLPMWLASLAALFTPLYYRLTQARPRFTPYSLHTLASNSHVSARKARRELGYRPRPPEVSIADTLHWFAQRGMLSLAPMRSPNG